MNFCFAVFVQAVYFQRMTTTDLFLAKIFLFAFSYPKTLALICLAGTAVLFGAVAVACRAVKKTAESRNAAFIAREALETQSDGFYLWVYNSVGFIQSTGCSRRLAVLLNLADGTQASFESVLEKLSPDSADALSRALSVMRTTNTPFSLELTDGTKAFLAEGKRQLTAKQTGVLDILWVRDITAVQNQIAELSLQEQNLRKRQKLSQEALNALPFPVWLRSADLRISACNAAYAEALHADSPQEAVEQGTELIYEKSPRDARVLAASARAAGKERKVREFVVMNGKRRKVEASEIPLNNQQTVGFVRDITAEQELQDSLDANIAAHNGVLEHLKTAIAVFDADTRLQFYNTSFLNLWDLDEEWLDSSPTYSHFLDALRNKRRLPENRDFAAYKARELKNFSSLVSETVEIIHLPSGIALCRTIIPHPQGGLLMTYEDVTGHLTMERSVTVLNETQETVFNHLREAVLLFGRDGRLKAANDSYKTLWNLKETASFSVPEIIEKQMAFFETDKNRDALKEQLTGVITAHSGEVFQILRPDGKVLEFSAYSVPGGGIFVSYADVSEEEKFSAAAAEKDKMLVRFKQAAAQTDRLRETFLNRLRGEILAADSTESQFLLDQTVDLALIESGSAVLELDSVDFASVLMGLIKTTAEQARKAAVSLQLDPFDATQIIADKRRLKQALFAFLSFAVADAAPQSTVALSVKPEKRRKFLNLEIAYSPAAESDESVFDKRFETQFAKNLIEMHGGTVEQLCRQNAVTLKILIPVK